MNCQHVIEGLFAKRRDGHPDRKTLILTYIIHTDKRMQLWEWRGTHDTEPKSPKQTKSNYGEEEHNSPPRIGNKAERTEQRWRSGEETTDDGGCQKLRDEAAAAAAKEESDEESDEEISLTRRR
ncbi:uncharacterized protein G2W53_040841 [Senna tora]|uniref:Uncharacterized protein n=1 Tax=Senna tora TaxID=362788 RepID=A0A834SCV5_9FABA|nr:uncharacterized protein G2W53_040841 [Senna tora]